MRRFPGPHPTVRRRESAPQRGAGGSAAGGHLPPFGGKGPPTALPSITRGAGLPMIRKERKPTGPKSDTGRTPRVRARDPAPLLWCIAESWGIPPIALLGEPPVVLTISGMDLTGPPGKDYERWIQRSSLCIEPCRQR